MPPSTLKKLTSTLQLSRDYSVVPAGLRWRSNTFFIISTVGVGLFTDLFLYGLVVPILPFMLEERVDLPKDQVQSAVAGLLASYAGASVVFSPIAGILADKTSTRQGPFLLGLTALLLATILLFSGSSLHVLIIARVLQGISAAVVWTIGLALCLETDQIFSFTSVGNLAAPLLGGVLYEKAGYVGVFGIGFAVLALDFIMRVLVIEKKVARRYHAEDPSQVNDLETTPGNRNSDEEEGNHDSSNDEESPLLGKKENRDRYKLSKDQHWICRKVPILPCLKDPGLLTALLVAFIQAVILGSLDATIPNVAQELFDFGPLKSGVLFLPLGALDLFLGPIAGWAVDRYGTKPAAVGGYAYLTPVLILLRLPHAGGTKQVVLYAPSIVEAGSIVQNYFEANPDFFGEEGPYAQLYGLNSMVFSAGLTVGPELAGELKQSIGYGNANLVLGIVCAITSVLCFFYIGGKPRMPKFGTRL
ncbi:major facilitator superfamily domain-containing protein [Delphinella strobiligena]|nr:major facilitator superfamily domain-containing protein [Delphinella strobiligena]